MTMNDRIRIGSMTMKWNGTMNRMKFFALGLFVALGMAGCSEPPQEVRLTAGDDMQYDRTEFTVEAGREVKLTFEHVGEMDIKTMGHNVVILQKGQQAVPFGQKASAKGGLGNGYLPQSMRDVVIAHTELLGGGEKDVITFTAPENPGDYPYVCTFTNHASVMNGKMIVEPAD